jgi:primosomal protein N' (replication factor Y)
MPLTLPWLDYTIPAELISLIKVGQLVKIPFRSKIEYGIVKKLIETSSFSLKLKNILEIGNLLPVYSNAQLNFFEEVSILYQTSLGFLLKGSFFSLQKSKLQYFFSLTFKEPLISPSLVEKPVVFTHSSVPELVKYLEENIQISAQNLILVPEVAQINQLVSQLSSEIKDKISILTSEVSPKKYTEHWFEIWSGQKTIVIGTRSALFLPFFNLKNIFFLDEANPSHKSWDMAPRFHARDIALLLSTCHQAKLHLIGHTLSVETYYFLQKGVFTSTLASRINSLKIEQTTLVHQHYTQKGNNSFLVENVLEKINGLHEGITFLFMHQRGSAHYIFCKDCNTAFTCEMCHNSYTYHARIKKLVCHACKYSTLLIVTCTSCGGNNIAMYEAGTEAVEGELKKMFPNRIVLSIDSDTKPLQIDYTKPTIIIGTQFAWNKINWMKVRCMVFVDTDLTLSIPEYKSYEYLWYSIRNAQYLLSSEAELLIQTKKPEHFIFTSLVKPDEFYTQELSERRKFSYPPFAYIVKLFYGCPYQEAAEIEARRLYRKLKELTSTSQTITISPPLAMKPYFTKKKYWNAVIIKINYRFYKRDIKWLLKQVRDEWKVDLNPNSLLGI